MKKPTKRKPKSEVAWIAWTAECSFMYWTLGRTKNDCLHEINSKVRADTAKLYKPVRVRITPLAVRRVRK